MCISAAPRATLSTECQWVCVRGQGGGADQPVDRSHRSPASRGRSEARKSVRWNRMRTQRCGVSPVRVGTVGIIAAWVPGRVGMCAPGWVHGWPSGHGSTRSAAEAIRGERIRYEASRPAQVAVRRRRPPGRSLLLAAGGGWAYRLSAALARRGCLSAAWFSQSRVSATRVEAGTRCVIRLLQLRRCHSRSDCLRWRASLSTCCVCSAGSMPPGLWYRVWSSS